MNCNQYEDRSEMFGRFLIENKSTVRETASYFGISKSTVHKDVSERLAHINSALYEEVKKLLEINKSERHLRGGNATKEKYKKYKNKKD